MFTNITLDNFQCHKHLNLKLDKITTLVGPSDSGKTAVLRAVDWLCFNHGRPSHFVKRGELTAAVVLCVDGHTIRRTTKDNSYVFDGEVFSAVGKSVPPVVSNLLRMSVDNVQWQHEYLYWFAQTGSGLISSLNKVVDLTKLDGWLRNGISKDRQFKEKEVYFTTRQEELVEEEVCLSVFSQIDSDLQVLEQSFVSLEKMIDKLADLSKICQDYNVLNVQKKHMSFYVADLLAVLDFMAFLVDGKSRCSTFVSLLSAYDQNVARCALLSDLCRDRINVNKLLEQRQRCETMSECLNKLSELSCVLIPQKKVMYNDLLFLLDVVGKMHTMSAYIADLSDCLNRHKCLTNNLAKQRSCFRAVQIELEQRSEGYCPVCGQVWVGCGGCENG